MIQDLRKHSIPLTRYGYRLTHPTASASVHCTPRGVIARVWTEHYPLNQTDGKWGKFFLKYQTQNQPHRRNW